MDYHGPRPGHPPHGLYLLLGQAKNPGPDAGFDDPEGWAVQDESDGAGDASREDMDTSSPPDETSGDQHGAASGHHGSPLRPVAPFCKAVRFDGLRPGCVFKRGESGLGYYRDSGPTVCVTSDNGNLALGYPQGLVTPLVLVLDDLVRRSPELRHSVPSHSLSALPLSSARGCTYENVQPKGIGCPRASSPDTQEAASYSKSSEGASGPSVTDPNVQAKADRGFHSGSGPSCTADPAIRPVTKFPKRKGQI